jgi:hypothetical protein
MATMVLSETRGLQLFRVIRGGIGFNTEAGRYRTVRLQGIRILTLDPERRQNRLAHRQQRFTRRWKGLSTEDAQAACDFSFSTSKLSPFFHSDSAMAAILRAKVSRAMVGFMPLASSA